MRAARVKAMAALAVLVCASLAGCLSTVDDGGDENPITMAVHYESTSGTILERVQNGATLSQTGVELAFDFARVTSKAGTMTTFTLDPGDDATRKHPHEDDGRDEHGHQIAPQPFAVRYDRIDDRRQTKHQQDVGGVPQLGRGQPLVSHHLQLRDASA